MHLCLQGVWSYLFPINTVPYFSSIQTPHVLYPEWARCVEGPILPGSRSRGGGLLPYSSTVAVVYTIRGMQTAGRNAVEWIGCSIKLRVYYIVYQIPHPLHPGIPASCHRADLHPA